MDLWARHVTVVVSRTTVYISGRAGIVSLSRGGLHEREEVCMSVRRFA